MGYAQPIQPIGSQLKQQRIGILAWTELNRIEPNFD